MNSRLGFSSEPQPNYILPTFHFLGRVIHPKPSCSAQVDDSGSKTSDRVALKLRSHHSSEAIFLWLVVPAPSGPSGHCGPDVSWPFLQTRLIFK